MDRRIAAPYVFAGAAIIAILAFAFFGPIADAAIREVFALAVGGLIATALLGVVLSREGEGLIDGFHLALIGAAVAAAGASLSALFLVGNVKMREV